MHDANEYRDHLGFNLIDGDKSMMIVVGDGCREREKRRKKKREMRHFVSSGSIQSMVRPLITSGDIQPNIPRWHWNHAKGRLGYRQGS